MQVNILQPFFENINLKRFKANLVSHLIKHPLYSNKK